MAIVITKKGKQINSYKVDVVCDECECEFTCDNTDFENGIIECPNCKNIIYQHTLPYNNMVRRNKKLDIIKGKIRDEIFETIDFEKIHNHMVNVGWCWGGFSGSVPTIDELKKTLEKLIYEAIDNKTTISTGGFKVKYNEYQKDEENPPTIGVNVVFYVTSASSDINVDTLEYEYY